MCYNSFREKIKKLNNKKCGPFRKNKKIKLKEYATSLQRTATLCPAIQEIPHSVCYIQHTQCGTEYFLICYTHPYLADSVRDR